jgi:hypothetical protein
VEDSIVENLEGMVEGNAVGEVMGHKEGKVEVVSDGTDDGDLVAD